MSKCLGCHHKIDDGYYFCSFTCAALCGFYSVTKGWIKHVSDLTKEEIDDFLNNDPVRVYDKNWN